MWPKLGEIPFIGLWHVVFTRFSGRRLPWPWPLTFDLINMSPAQVHTRPNFSEISSDIYEIFYSSGTLWLLLAVTVTFDLWSQKLTSTSMNPNTSVTNLGEITFTGLWDGLRVFGDTRWPWPLTIWPRNLITTSRQIHLWSKLGEIPFIGLWDKVFTWFLGCTDWRTHSRMDRPENTQNSLPPAPFFNGGAGIKSDTLNRHGAITAYWYLQFRCYVRAHNPAVTSCGPIHNWKRCSRQQANDRGICWGRPQSII